MLKRKPKSETSALDEIIDDATSLLNDYVATDAEYPVIISQLERLHALKPEKAPKRVSPDVLATVAGNLIGIIVIVGHERAHVVTSKALTFVMKAAR